MRLTETHSGAWYKVHHFTKYIICLEIFRNLPLELETLVAEKREYMLEDIIRLRSG